jgi:GntR family transcriptional regulator
VARRLTKITPLYHQVFSSLRDQITGGDYQKADALPSEIDLAEDFGVSRITVRRALEELAANGLVTREQGSGTFVSGKSAVQPVRFTIDDFSRWSMSIKESSKVTRLSSDWIDARPQVARKLEIDSNAKVYQIRICRTFDVPTLYSIGYFPESIGKQLDARRVGLTPTIELLREMKITVARVELMISSIAAGADEAAILKVAAGAPLTLMERIFFDHQQRPVALNRMTITPDRHELSMTFAVPAQE